MPVRVFAVKVETCEWISASYKQSEPSGDRRDWKNQSLIRCVGPWWWQRLGESRGGRAAAMICQLPRLSRQPFDERAQGDEANQTPWQPLPQHTAGPLSSHKTPVMLKVSPCDSCPYYFMIVFLGVPLNSGLFCLISNSRCGSLKVFLLGCRRRYLRFTCDGILASFLYLTKGTKVFQHKTPWVKSDSINANRVCWKWPFYTK